MSLDVLIVGQGLAGSILAWELMRHGLSVQIIDNGAVNASRVAAGLINPVTGQRLVKSHAVDVLLPEAMALYQQLAERFGQKFFVAKPMWRLLSSAKQRQQAEQRLLDAEYRAYLGRIVEAEPGITASHGVLQQCQTGYLRTVAMLDQLRAFFIAENSFRQCSFEHAELILQPRLQWRDVQPRYLVFCEGYQLTTNPWFGGLPLQPAKGEILHGKTSVACPEAILNYGFWLLPDGQQSFKTGATFNADVVDQLPTEHASQRLLQALRQVFPALAEVQLIDHQVGIRPTTVDKQPFIGSHPRHSQLYVFNGFGAKGSLAIPYYARQLVDHFLKQTPLPMHGDIRRYHDTHFAG